MNIIFKPFGDMWHCWSKETIEFKQSFVFLLLTFFMILATYPMTRTTTTSLFMSYYGGKSTPLVWFFSVVSLSGIVTIYNHIYRKFSIHKIFLATSLISVAIFSILPFALNQVHFLAFVLFIWKEVYIVLLIHLVLGFFNESVKSDFAKLFYGIIGAVGSVGGILGGVLVHFLTYSFSTEMILIGSGAPILLGAISFSMVKFQRKNDSTNLTHIAETPLASIKSVRQYVFLFVVVLAISQVVISFANFKFNILFDQLVPLKDDKTRYLSSLYSYVNVVSLIIQLICIPYLFRYFSLRKIHFFIPLFYTVIIFIGFFMFGNLFAVSAVFVGLKGNDYSLFNAAKELLYFPLKNMQKTGAKYIVDMVAYRGAKGAISFVLIFWQTERFITTGLFVALVVWIIALYFLFHERSQLLKN